MHALVSNMKPKTRCSTAMINESVRNMKLKINNLSHDCTYRCSIGSFTAIQVEWCWLVVYQLSSTIRGVATIYARMHVRTSKI